MTRKIGIIGVGHVGSTVAHYLVANGFTDELVLIDTNTKKVEADALDFREAMPNLPFHTEIIVNDYGALRDADIIISALGNIRLNDQANEDRFVELPFNSENVKQVAARIRDVGFNGIIIAITNPVDVITQIYQQVTGLPQKHVLGTGTLLDSARMKRAVSERLKLDPRAVSGYNLGEHGNSQFTAWSTVYALDQPLTKLAPARGLDLAELDSEARRGGFAVFKGKGYTSYGVATAAVRLALAIMSDAHLVLPISNFRSEYQVYLSYPVIVGRDGVLQDNPLQLTKQELEQLQHSADFIKSNVAKYLG
ncbi:L-lactate dehydrogenase [Fructilactobacillus florum]|uniref:L-2-hydroxyisocaproate dehydrogenase n=1 Tax=Fructilactobacillus florum DSM 22689 = JCM 16035 TaxID=1423745 RepID=A0A0R2CXN9_9LACO|nr:L-lactate dehydrogenase [Fructilactobacillus florum]EKK20047.1 L-lactate dehydrogenase [Fructilactobacillus florum 2F]KRM92566.1 L-2-hydroxyisocaproate dehydrogenase [Fructilactobacillus florum DSM 22689 = JCM 16035]